MTCNVIGGFSFRPAWSKSGMPQKQAFTSHDCYSRAFAVVLALKSLQVQRKLAGDILQTSPDFFP